MLVEPFLARVAEPLRTQLASVDDLETRLAQLSAEARAAWPGIKLDPLRFVVHLADRVPGTCDPAQLLAHQYLGDLYLACACAAGDPAALAAFDDTYMGEARTAAAKLRLGQEGAADLANTVREALFVAAVDAEPKIARYRGTGPLRAWLRVTITRMGLRWRGRESRQAIPDSELIGQAQGEGTLPELQYIKRLYRDEFSAAFREAAEALTPRQRTLLRQQYLDGLTGDELAALYRVHRATVVRWLGDARRRLLLQTRKTLATRLRVEVAEADSILRLIRSQLDLSMPFFFAVPGE